MTVWWNKAEVIVIGAGLGGLCLAQGLHRAGVGVAVYEKDDSPAVRAQGYRLHINSDGWRALASTLSPELFALVGATAGYPRPYSAGYDSQLNLTSTFALDGRHAVVNRQTLRQILLGELDEIVHFGRECVGYSSDKTTVTAHFADGSSKAGSVLVAADGIGSVIRAQYLPHARIADSGVRLLYGRVPLTKELKRALPTEMFSVFNAIVGPGKRFVGLAPVEYREQAQKAAPRLAPQVAIDPTEDYLAAMFGGRLELLGTSDDELRGVRQAAA